MIWHPKTKVRSITTCQVCAMWLGGSLRSSCLCVCVTVIVCCACPYVGHDSVQKHSKQHKNEFARVRQVREALALILANCTDGHCKQSGRTSDTFSLLHPRLFSIIITSPCYKSGISFWHNDKNSR